MATEVVMPQMGESIAEGTVSRWLKKVGDKVERDEPLLEISTDKVDAEIPSPAAGVLSEILVKEGDTVPVNAPVARITAEGEAPAASAPAEPAKPATPAADEPKPDSKTVERPKPQPEPEPEAIDTPAADTPEVVEATPEAKPAPSTQQAETPTQDSALSTQDSEGSEDAGEVASLDERRRTKSSPLVRKIAKENNVDISRVPGTGVSGRVTKNDILEFLQKPAEEAPAPASAPAARAPQPAPARPQFAEGQNVRLEPLSVMRKRIAQHMIQSKQTSAHVTTVFEVDFTNVDKLRRRHKEDYAGRGVKLTFLPFIVQAVINGLREFPVLNASMDETNVIYHREHNIGIAVALDWGLIVPVLKQADELNILGIARAVNDLGDRARAKKLSPDDVQGGTFTITNPGIFGSLFGTPIINQPQVAILGVGGVKKRPVVVETKDGDFIGVRSMAYLALTFDHRLVDGAVADQFMARVKATIEAGQFTM